MPRTCLCPATAPRGEHQGCPALRGSSASELFRLTFRLKSGGPLRSVNPNSSVAVWGWMELHLSPRPPILKEAATTDLNEDGEDDEEEKCT